MAQEMRGMVAQVMGDRSHTASDRGRGRVAGDGSGAGWTSREPVMVVNAGVLLIEAIIPVLLTFGVLSWSAEQTGAVLTLVLAVSGAVKTWFVRSRVRPDLPAGVVAAGTDPVAG